MGAAMDDQRLVALAQEGNPDAFSLLVERHQTMVYNTWPWAKPAARRTRRK